MRKTIQILKELRDSDESIKFTEIFLHLSEDEKKELRESEKALDDAIKALENSSWIPIKTRKLSPEEIREFCEKTHEYSPEEMDGAWSFDCKLPEKTQDVLVTTRYGDVVITKFVCDLCEWYFEDFEDEGDLLAWMPLPEHYENDEEE